MQKRGKPGQTSSPTGQALHKHATELAVLALELAHVSDAGHSEPIHPKRVVEAFPNAFLAAMLDDSAFTALARNASDVFWKHLIATGALQGLCDTLLPHRTTSPGLEHVTNHEERAGVVCALTALVVLGGSYVAVGDRFCGDIILPPQTAWGVNAVGQPWLCAVLDAAGSRIRCSRRPKPGFDVARVLSCEMDTKPTAVAGPGRATILPFE